MNSTIYHLDKTDAGSLALNPEIFGYPYKESLVHQVLVSFLNKSRAGTHAQKTRAEVRGGGKKPWRQKGTGRARAGTIRSPIWRKGGVVFAAKPRDYSQKINRKMYRSSIKSIFSELFRLERIFILKSIDVDNPKTRTFLDKFKAFSVADKSKFTIIITEEFDENLILSTQNLYNVALMTPSTIDVKCLVQADQVLITENSIKLFEGMLS